MPTILIVTGPPGAGKSATCQAFLESASGTWAHIAQDDIRDLIRAGFASANASREEWTDEVKRQWAVAIPICCDLVRRYNEHGISCVMELSASASEFAEWRSFLGEVEYKLAILLPDVDSVLKRNAQRTGTAKLSERKIREEHQMFRDWLNDPRAKIIDNTSLSVSQTVELLKQKSGC